MEQLNPIQPAFPASGVRPMIPGGPNPMPTGLSFPGHSPFGPQIQGSAYSYEQNEKKKQFARGIFVSGFEKNVATAMIMKHFSIKPIHGLKHPTTKFKQSKGFAFIYYGSEDDAMFVKKTLDRTAILKEKVRITRTVISENLSKMMFKLKTHGFSEKQLQERENRYFNDQNLEKEVERIIKPLLGDEVEVNKITIPRSKADKKPLRYARVFFYVSDVKKAKDTAQRAFKSMENPPYQTDGKNQYEIILNYISDRINNDPTFSSYAKSQIYEYTKKNQSNILHLKGVKTNPNEDPEALSEELKQFIQNQSPQWNIVNVYASVYEKRGAWANVTFSTHQETIQAYEHLKSLRPKFRDQVLYGSLRNVKDPRTVVVSVVKQDIVEKQVEKFLNQLASNSQKINELGDETIRKYDYFSFNIIESRTFFKIDGDDTKGVPESELKDVHPSWIQINKVPRRLIIHFFHEFNEEDIKELNNDITVTPSYEEIFLKDDTNKKQLRSNHQKGHVNKDGVYIKHTELKSRKKPKQPKGDKPRRPLDNARMGPGARVGVTKPNLNINLDMSLPMKGAPKMNMNQPQFRPPQVGGMPSMPPGMRPPFPNANMPPMNPPPFKPFGNKDMPTRPMGMPQGIPPMNQSIPPIPPQGIPPMGQGVPPMPQGVPPPMPFMGQGVPSFKPPMNPPQPQGQKE